MSFITKAYQQPLKRWQINRDNLHSDLYQVNLSRIRGETHNLGRKFSILANRIRTMFQTEQIQINQDKDLFLQPIDRVAPFPIILSNRNSRVSNFFQKNKTCLKVTTCWLGVFLVVSIIFLMASSSRLRVKMSGLMK